MIYRGRINEIIFEFAIPEGEQKGIVILCDGMPSVPKQKELLMYLSRKGFFVVFPRYRGTWESEGSFLANPLGNDIEEIIAFLAKGSITELYAGETFLVKQTPLYLVGSSFGGTIALSLISNSTISKIVAFSPLISFAGDLSDLKRFIRLGFGNGYRFTDAAWEKMASGQLFSLPMKISAGRNKDVLAICDSSDRTVDTGTIEAYAKENDILIMKTNNIGHLSFSKIPNETWEYATKWLLNSED